MTAFEKKVHKIQKGVVVGIVSSHELAWAKWTSKTVVFHMRPLPDGGQATCLSRLGLGLGLASQLSQPAGQATTLNLSAV